MSKRKAHLYEFGNFSVNVAERLLFKEGQIVATTPKVFETLIILIENGGHLVKKEDLIRRLWPNTFVEESSLTQNISLLRKALDEGAAGQQYIQTVPKRGYRFLPEIRTVWEEEHTEEEFGVGDESPEKGARSLPSVVEDKSEEELESRFITEEVEHSHLVSRRVLRPSTFLLVIGALLALATFLVYRWQVRARREITSTLSVKSIAVLPFKTIGAQGEEDLLGLGMADAIILKLSKLDNIEVRPTGTIFAYTKRNKDAHAIGQELKVEAILDGTVQHADNVVRVTAQLIRLSDSKTLWMGKFDEQYSHIFNIQDSISTQISNALSLQIARGNDKKGGRPFTQNTVAYQSYLLGLHFWNQGGKDELNKAITHFERAVEQDPEFAMAHTYLADCYYFNVGARYTIIPDEESLKRARTHLATALSLDQTIAEAHTVLAGIKTLEKDYEGAEVEYKLAIELNPDLAMAHNRYGVFLFNRSNLEGAVSEMQRGLELNPASRVFNRAFANMLLFARKYDESINYSKRSLEIDPNYSTGMMILGEGYYLKGLHDEAVAKFEELVKRDPTQRFQQGKIDLVIAYASVNRKREAENLLREILESREEVIPYNIATAYAALGDRDKAFEWLGKEKLTPFRMATLKFDPFLDPLRSDPRFTELLQKPLQD